jgi:hypothetical protein
VYSQEKTNFLIKKGFHSILVPLYIGLTISCSVLYILVHTDKGRRMTNVTICSHRKSLAKTFVYKPQKIWHPINFKIVAVSASPIIHCRIYLDILHISPSDLVKKVKAVPLHTMEILWKRRYSS